MNSKDIEVLVRYLPPNSPYPRSFAVLQSAGDAQSAQEALWATCLNDPAFGYHFVMSFVSVNINFPCGVTHSKLRRAYRYLAHLIPDHNLSLARSLTHPLNHNRKTLIDGILIAGDMSLSDVAKQMNLPLEAVSLYEQLWFNVQDRLEDMAFISSLLFPETKIADLSLDEEAKPDYYLQMLRAGHQFGSAEVLFLAGFSSSRPIQADAQGLESSIMDEALTHVRHGRIGSKASPAVERAKAILVATKKQQIPKNPDEIMGLGAVSASRSILDTIAGIQFQENEERIQMQQKEHDQNAAEMSSNKAILSSASVV